MDEYLSVAATLPADGCAGTLVGRVWLPGEQRRARRRGDARARACST